MNEAISGGRFLAPRNILRNLALVGDPSFAMHGMVMLLALGGSVVLVRSHERAVAWLLIGAALGSALVVLAYDRFHERMLFGATVCLLPLAGLMFDSTRPPGTRRWRRMIRPLAAGVAIALTAWLCRDALPWLPILPETQLLETRIASRIARLPLAADALFIAEQPPVLAAAGMPHVMATAQALRSEEQLWQVVNSQRPVYFLCDMFCEPDHQAASTAPMCARIFERFSLSPVAEETLNVRTYGLYRITGPAVGGAPSRRCPHPR
jgi:hypothetical protein